MSLTFTKELMVCLEEHTTGMVRENFKINPLPFLIELRFRRLIAHIELDNFDMQGFIYKHLLYERFLSTFECLLSKFLM